MNDILFILLIFFLVTTSFARQSGVRVQRPGAASAQPVDAAAILIAVRPGGAPIACRAICAAVSRLHGMTPGAPVVIQADRKADVGPLVQVMDQVRLAGIQDIAVAAEAP